VDVVRDSNDGVFDFAAFAGVLVHLIAL
jgi:hypothetical protein